MKVETYEEVETTNEAKVMAQDAASLELIEKLGLEGQKTLSNPQTVTRSPYREITAEERFVYRTLCPRVSTPEAYTGGPIPLRVLQIMAWAKDNPMFKRLEIWSADTVTSKDPVLVGIMQVGSSSWNEATYIMARWADELLPMQVLLPEAFKRWVSRQKREAVEQKRRAERKIADMEEVSEMEPHVPTDFL